jgi:DNA-binding SARP family transcriptional activator
MSQLALHLLGPPRLELDGQVVQVSRRKAMALLAYLAVTGRCHSRDSIATLLWPELDQSTARARLRRALVALREALGDGWLDADRDTIGLNPDAEVWLDVDAFHDQLAACETHDHPPTETCPDCIPLLEAAVTLYRDHFLAGFTLRDSANFDEWQFFQTEELKDELAGALVRLATYHTSQGDFEPAIGYARRWLALDPLHEPAHRHLMVLYAQSNQRAAALRQYEICQQVLADELGVEPSEKTQETYERLLKGELPAGPTAVEAILERELRTVGECPYRGLAPFRETDAAFFFGREAFTERLAEAIRTQPMVAVIVGSSGSGKSSAVFAGLLPQLREEGNWLIADLRPGNQPCHALAAALLPLLEPDLDETDRLVETRKLTQALDERGIPLYDVAERALDKNTGTSRLLLLIDQFEELYTLCPEPEVRRSFVDALLAAVEAVEERRDSPFVLLVTMRADFMGQALAHRPFVDALQESSLLLGPMTREELGAAIEKPAEKQGAALEAGLVERLLDDVGQEPGNLPLVEFALTLLWERLDYGWMTHKAYEEIGRVEGALTHYAQQVYDDLTENEREGTRRIFMQLVQPGEGTEDTRRVATRAEIGESSWSLVQHLADKRLVVTGQDPATRNETVEVVHEALI